jgi:hypothetical protein
MAKAAEQVAGEPLRFKLPWDAHLFASVKPIELAKFTIYEWDRPELIYMRGRASGGRQ